MFDMAVKEEMTGVLGKGLVTLHGKVISTSPSYKI